MMTTTEERFWVQTYSKALLIAAGGVLLFLGTILFAAPHPFRQTISHLLQVLTNLITISGMFLAARFCRRQSRQVSRSLVLIGIGQAFLLAGDMSWFLYDAIYHGSPFESTLISTIYLLYYPFLFAGIFTLPTVSRSLIAYIKNGLEAVIIIISSVLVYWNFSIAPILASGSSIIPVNQSKYILFILCHAIFILAFVFLQNCRRDVVPDVVFVAIGFTIVGYLVINSLYSYQVLKSTYVSGGWVDLGWVLLYLLFGAIALMQIHHHLGIHQHEWIYTLGARLNRILLDLFPALPYLMLIFAYVILVQTHGSPGINRFGQIALTVGTIILLAITRLGIESVENRQLNRRLHTTLEMLQMQQKEISKTNHELEGEITVRRQAEAQLAHDALHDWLTQLPNRVLFLDRLGHALELSRRCSEIRFSVLFLDLDQFKVINDSMGHNKGDELLVAVGTRLIQCVRSSDTVARLGGDEFVFLLETSNTDSSILPMANRIMNVLSAPFKLQEQTAFITASIGIVEDVSGYASGEDVLRDADIAMYQAKAQGKNCLTLFEPGMRSRAITRLEMENDLRSAIDNHEFILHYQPIVGLGKDGLVGFEALIRWNHPTHGMIPPSDFIKIAEESGLIIPIGKWVLHEACSQLKFWQSKIRSSRNLFVNVNISGRQFSQPDFVNLIKDALIQTRLAPECLKLEITESVLIENYALANAIFQELAAMGIQFEIDDFGTGYSSIGYLRHFPIHTIKIDKSFIHDMDEGSRGSDLIQAIISMANNLGMETIAEGVETKEQLQKLLGMKCGYGQGYYLSHPLPEDAAEKYLESYFLFQTNGKPENPPLVIQPMPAVQIKLPPN
jgi:diguanylate cyclase (GGDEF)-like protein